MALRAGVVLPMTSALNQKTMPRTALLQTSSMKLSRLLPFTLFILTPLIADQFAYIQPDMAKKALALLQKEKDVFFYCEPCGEVAGKIEPIKTVDEIDVNYEGHHEVRINGAGIDLAYTYIRRNGKWKNIAFELGLKPHGVSAEVPFNAPPRKPTPDR